MVVNGVRTHFIRLGRGEPVALVHGFTASHALWFRQAPALARAGFEVLAYDLRGHGDSAHPGAGYDLQTLAADLLALLDGHRLGRVHLVGLSLGGMIAQRFTLAHPERVQTLTVADSFSGAPPEEVLALFRRHERFGREHGLGRLFERLLVQPALPYGPDFQLQLRELPAYEKAFRKNRLETMSAFIAMMAGLPDWTAELARLSRPTLLLVGDHDLPCLEPMRRMRAAIPGARLEIVPRAGHSSAVEKPEEFNARMFEFLRRHPTPGAASSC